MLVTSHDHFNQSCSTKGKIVSVDILPQKAIASEGKIAMKDILPQEAKIEEFPNCLAGHGRAGLTKSKCPRSTGGYGLDVAGYGRSGPEESWTVPSLLDRASCSADSGATSPVIVGSATVRLNEIT